MTWGVCLFAFFASPLYACRISFRCYCPLENCPIHRSGKRYGFHSPSLCPLSLSLSLLSLHSHICVIPSYSAPSPSPQGSWSILQVREKYFNCFSSFNCSWTLRSSCFVFADRISFVHPYTSLSKTLRHFLVSRYK